MVASMQVHVIHRCRAAYLSLGFSGLPTSNHVQNFLAKIRGRSCRVNCEDTFRLMVASPLQLDFELTYPGLTTGLPPNFVHRRMYALVPDIGGLEALGHPDTKVWCPLECQASSGNQGLLPKELHDVLWQQFFSDPTQWQDNRWSKPTARHADFVHKKSKAALWLNDGPKPAWVYSQLQSWDSAVNWPLDSGSTSIRGQGSLGTSRAHESRLEVEMCRKLCEDGRVIDAVNALDLLVQRGCHVDNNLFYCVLKRCISVKDLVLGRRIHALTIKSGYEGDAFLATHLIGLYASHRRLDEAMRVFAKVSTPDAYNWATIISAYARHGEDSQAIQLYRKMRESDVKVSDHIYVAVLKACAGAGDLVAGKDVHAHILASPGNPDVFVQTGLVNMYAKCGSLDDARRVFDNLAERDVVTWTTLIAGYTQQRMGQEALALYSNMQQEGLNSPSSVTFVCLLQACSGVGPGALDQGKQLHAQIEERGLQHDVVVGGSLVNMYVKCGNLEDAGSVFDKLLNKNVVTWNAMLSGYAQQGLGWEALRLYDSMQQEDLISPDSVTFVCLLQACANEGVGALDQGKQFHEQAQERGLQSDEVVGGSLVNMYAKCGSLEEARRVFNRLPHRHVITWNAMLSGYAQEGMGKEALILYTRMQQEDIAHPNSVTFVCLLQACSSVAALPLGKQLHAQIEGQGLQGDVVLGGSLVNMYAKCGSLEDARSLFDTLMDRNVVTWNAMLLGYAQQGMGQEALTLYSGMQEGITAPNSLTFASVLHACAGVGAGALHQGQQLHAQIEGRGLQDDVILGNSLINMYAKCGSLDEACSVFDRLPQRNVVTWNALLAGYAQQGMGQDALRLYYSVEHDCIPSPNSVTFVCLLQACACVGVPALHQGRQLHAQAEERGLLDDVVVGGSLVNMYGKCGRLEEARSLFDILPNRNVVTWNAMLASYVQQGMSQGALALYSTMQQEGVTPNSVTFVCLLQACASTAALPLGKQLHARIEKEGLQTDVVGAVLVNMYAKCGSMLDAQRVFDSLSERNIEAWGALAGLVEKGRKYFEVMRADHGISPTVEHYACMMDLLGRAGHLDEALQMAKTAPFPPDSTVWLTLLGACQKWKDIEVGQQAFELAVSMDGKDAASYMLMSNIYANAEMWQEAKEIQARRMKSGAWKKQPGQSWWADVGGEVHSFVSGTKAWKAVGMLLFKSG